MHLEDWFRSWVPESVYCAGGGWSSSALDIEEVLSGAVDSFDTVDGRVLDMVLE